MGFSAHATDVCGLIVEDTIWTKTGSPYIVTCNVTVLASITLNIEPGVEVKFNQNMALIIHGTLIASGTESDKIIFTSNGGQKLGYWHYILFSDTSADAIFDPDGNYISGCIIQYAIVEYGGGGDSVITIDKSSPFIDKSVITNNAGSGIYISGGSPVISSVITNNSDSGIYINSGYPTIKDSTISDNYGAWDGGGIYASSCNKGAITIQNSTISGNEADFDGGGISASASTIIIQNSTISGNDAWFKGGIEASSSTITIEGSTISDNHSDDAVGIYAYSSTVTIENSTISNHVAPTGSGIYADASTIIIKSSKIIQNTASDTYGSILYLKNLKTGSVIWGRRKHWHSDPVLHKVFNYFAFQLGYGDAMRRSTSA
ncbi:right-handed parallel beta-helix repeat-containing protein [Candidatus Poribacteria bacterium]|nr:right-handed parallel beta-helix repeat-containing protein [Candidatus Poribacteria bacterium]